ncbi:hypothetical protein [Nesterenkonia lutea]|uniref:Secreted protein n=1 Tax=Nesterenkonia lutea TaxID=272919 RepID=A0ABR9JFY8_9MICC|nr:hypothetical protein [Nesterenkonia lutea]MBE1524845.1 hypothetical protein [Nesterenkonia lutea]
MNQLPAPSAALPSRAVRTSTRLRGMLTLALIAPLGLIGCTVEEESDASTDETATPSAAASEETGTEESTAPEADSDASAEPTSQGSADDGEDADLPDPDAMDMERTEELGAFFSEEEACLSVGSMVDGLHEDMNQGIEEQDILDDAYSAVEQTYILVPVELREPLEKILTLLDTDVEDLDEEEVLVAAEPVDGWLTVEFCDGQYHNQTHSDEDAQS